MTLLTLKQKLAVAKMVPEHVEVIPPMTGTIRNKATLFYWKHKISYEITDRGEWLYVLHLAELTLPQDNSMKGRVAYDNILMTVCGSHQAAVSATAFQRATALMKVAGGE